MATLDDDTTDRIDRLVRDLVHEASVPGASVAVLADGEEWATGVGSRDLATNAPATPDTTYGVGSCTKSLAALAVLQLEEREALAVDDAVTDHLDVEVPADVTLHDLLTHSSGYPSLGVSEALLARALDLDESGVPLGDRADFHDHVATARDERVATDRFMYCNTGYYLLDEVIERVDGRPFAEYAAEELLAPLGMDRATFDVDAVREREDALTPYHLGDDGPEAATLPDRDLGTAPGGLFAPVTDLLAYLRLHLDGGEVDGRRLLSADALARTHADHVATPDGPYGYGWWTRERFGERIVGHSGSIAVSSAYLGFLPESDVGVAVAANASPPFPLAALGEAVAAVVQGHDRTAVPFFARRERFDRYVGEYETHRGIRTATVERDGGCLRIEFSDAYGGAEPLVPVDGTAPDGEFYTYTALGDRDPVRFVTDDDGVSLLYDRFRLRQV